MAVFNLRERSPGGPAWIQATRAIRIVKATKLWDGFTFTQNETFTETTEWVGANQYWPHSEHFEVLRRAAYTNQRITATINGETIVVTEYPDGYYEHRYVYLPWWADLHIYWEYSNYYYFNSNTLARDVTMINQRIDNNGRVNGYWWQAPPEPWICEVAHTHAQLHEMLFPSGGPYTFFFMIPLTSGEHGWSHKSYDFLSIDSAGPFLESAASNAISPHVYNSPTYTAAEESGHWAASWPIVIHGTGLDGQPLTQSISFNDVFDGAFYISPPARENSITSIT